MALDLSDRPNLLVILDSHGIIYRSYFALRDSFASTVRLTGDAAEELEPRLYFTARVDTVCGILIADRPRRVRLFDMGAPDQPTCPVCSKEGLPPGLLADVREALERADREPVEV